jgi:pyruvate-ferredoxin/flavodoxin oxidoreductase
VCTVLYKEKSPIEVIGGRYGLASKDTTPAQIISVFDHLATEHPKSNFTVGIVDDVTLLSLPLTPEVDILESEYISCKIWGVGADGTVGANKNTIKIIGNNTDQFVQAYFVYDSKKSGGLTQSHLRFGKSQIRSTYLVNMADFVACHKQSYVNKYDLTKDLKEGGVFLLNCDWTGDELEKNLPAKMKKELARKKARFYTLDAVSIARELGLGGRINTVLQAAFFKLVNIIPYEEAVKHMKDAIYKTYNDRKGQEVVAMNCKAVDLGGDNLIKVEIPQNWVDLSVEEEAKSDGPEFIGNVVAVMNRQEGDTLPVSTFKGMEDGSFPPGTTAYEKRGAAVDIPEWKPENCIQCNQCAYVCPHAAIRPILLDDKESAVKPDSFETKNAIGKGLAQYNYRMQLSPLDCMGCASCVTVCPAKEKALVMKPLASQMSESENWVFAINNVAIKKDAIGNTVKTSQFAQPLFEFSGACAGCGETPYIKLATQLFGDRMFIANASGCSTAYGGSAPSMPYTINKKGHGPAWAMSLFEDTAEYAYGMLLASEHKREKLIENIETLQKEGIADVSCTVYLEEKDNSDKTKEVSEQLVEDLQSRVIPNAEQKALVDEIITNREYLSKKSYWAFGGDGWAYDIGYGGLDHVLASGKDINMLVLDTEVYSNTGGQSSKATAVGAVAKFASSGKREKKKDLGMMAMSYGYVYVAQVAMGADQNQLLKAMKEAEAYPGPSLVIAYCPCIEHGLKSGMSCSQLEMKKAVESGYWHLYRYNPLMKEEGQNPFTLDSKAPNWKIREFLEGENRFASLKLTFPEVAEKLYAKAEKDLKERYDSYVRLANN